MQSGINLFIRYVFAHASVTPLGTPHLTTASIFYFFVVADFIIYLRAISMTVEDKH